MRLRSVWIGFELWNQCNLRMNGLRLFALGEEERNQRRIDQAKE
jgi:hypothetical protein